MLKNHLPTNEISQSTPNSESFKGFLLASYKSIANVARAHKITRLMLLTYLLILVVTPPIIIMIAFLTFPTQTASFFNFQVQPKQPLTQSANSQVLGEHTSNTNQVGGNVLGQYIAAVLEPQAAATVQALRVINPETVSEIILPSEQTISQPTQSTTSTAGPPGPAGADGTQGETGLQGAAGLAGKDGAKGDTGATGATGAAGSIGTLTTGAGLTGTLASGNITLNLDTNTLNIASGKTLTVNKTITFGGTDNTSFTLPSSSDTLIGLTSTDTLTNKTIAAGSNTISGLTNTNLSGTAGITNANLANSSLTVTAGSGLVNGGAVSLGGSTTLNINLTTSGTTGSTSSNSGLEVSSSGLALLKGCTDNEILKWTDANGWACAADGTGGSATLQTVYDNGNTLLTTTGRNIAFTLGEVASPTSLTLENQDTAGVSSQRIFNSIASGTLTNGLLIEQTGAGTLTNAIQITETTGTITDGILITGTLGNILNSASIDITGAGAITGLTGLTMTSGALTLSGLSASSISTGANDLTFTSSNFNTTATGINSTAIGQTTAAAGKFTTLTSTGVTDLANAGASNVTIATTGTGNVTIGNSTGTFALTSSGGLNVTTGGALTGVASIDTISVSATGLTFAGAGTISSTTTSALTLDSGTTGNVNLGTGNNAKTIAIGTGTAGNTINIGTNNTTADTIAIGSALDAFSLTSTGLNVTTGGVITGATGLILTSGNITTPGNISTTSTGTITSASTLTASSGLTMTTGALNLTSTSGGVSLMLSSSATAFKVDNIFDIDTTNSRVGIGTTAPSQTLHVQGTEYVSGNIGIGTSSPGVRLAVAGGGLFGYSGTQNLSSGASLAISGNVGIGTTSPQAALDVIGTASFSDQITASNMGIEFSESDTNPTCAAGNFNIYADLSENKLKKCQNGVASDLNAIPDVNSFTDTTTEAIVDADTTDYWDGTAPNITPKSTTSEILVMMSASITGTSATDTQITAQILRHTSAITCQTTGTAVGGQVGTFQGFTAGSVDMGKVFVDTPATVSNIQYTLCSEADTEATNGTMARIDFTLFEVNDAADLAEVYPTNDNTLTAGEVVTFDPNLNAGIARSNKAYDKNAIGVISTKPALVIGGRNNEGLDGKPVALSGRVPVKVKGPVKKGDILTSSSTAGAAMKAIKAGPILGVAMTDYNGKDVGSVMLFVKTGYFNGSNLAEIIANPIQTNTNSVNIEDFGKTVLNYLVQEKIDTNASAIEASEVFTDRIAAGLEVITPKVITQDILATRINATGDATFSGTLTVDTIKARRIEGLEILTNQLSLLTDEVKGVASSSAELIKTEASTQTNILDLIAKTVSDVFKNTVNFVGNVIFHADVTFLGRPTFNKDTAGHAFIKAGNSEVSIIFDKEYAQNPVVSANVNLVGGIRADEIPSYAVYDVSSKGLKIKLSKATGFDLSFSWIALAVNEDNMSISSGVSDTPMVSQTPTLSVTPLVTPLPSPEITPTPTSAPTPSPTPAITTDQESTSTASASPL